MAPWRVKLPLSEVDVDYLGHITAVAHLALFEHSRALWLREVTEEPEPAFALVRQELDYRRELLLQDGPANLDAQVVKLTRSTATIRERLASDAGEIRTESRAVIVRWDRRTRRSMPFSEAERARLEAYADLSRVPGGDGA